MTTIVLNQNYITEAVELIEASLPADNNFSEADDAYFIASIEEITSSRVVLHVIDGYSDFYVYVKDGEYHTAVWYNHDHHGYGYQITLEQYMLIISK